MKKITILSSVILGLFYSSYISAACGSFAFRSKEGLKFEADGRNSLSALNIFMDQTKLDSKEIDLLYTCVLQEAKSAKNATDKKVAHTTAFNQALLLEAQAKAFKKVIDDATATIGSASATVQASITTVKSAHLATISKYATDAGTIADKSSKLASGISAQYETLKASSDPSLPSKDNIEKQNEEYNKLYGRGAETDSAIGRNKDKDDADVVSDIATVGYPQDTSGSENFNKDITDNKFDIVSASPSGRVETPPTTSPSTSGKTNPIVITDKTGDTKNNVSQGAPADQAVLYGELVKQLADIQAKEKEKAKTTTPAATSTTPASSSSSISNPSAGSVRSFEQDREKRAQEQEALKRKQTIAQILRDARMRTKFPKSKNLAYEKDKSSAGSGFGSSLFTPKTSTDDVNKKTKPSIFDKAENGTTATKTTDYNKYYSSLNVPGSPSSKEKATSRFASMYEMARRKALIEDAKSEFAGRYVDIFLLQHSIIYHYYSRGLLIDIGEAVAPIGDSEQGSSNI